MVMLYRDKHGHYLDIDICIGIIRCWESVTGYTAYEGYASLNTVYTTHWIKQMAKDIRANFGYYDYSKPLVKLATKSDLREFSIQIEVACLEGKAPKGLWAWQEFVLKYRCKV